MVFAGRQWYTHECKTEQCARLSLRLIPSRRITVKRGQDPLAVCCGCLLKSGGGLDLRLRLSVAFFPECNFLFRLNRSCLLHISMRRGYIFCSAALPRKIRLVGHDDITRCLRYQTHIQNMTVNLWGICLKKHPRRGWVLFWDVLTLLGLGFLICRQWLALCCRLQQSPTVCFFFFFSLPLRLHSSSNCKCAWAGWIVTVVLVPESVFVFYLGTL